MESNYLHWAALNLQLLLFFLATVIVVLHKCARWRMSFAEIIYRWYVLFPIGFNSLYTFYILSSHTLPGVMNALPFAVAMANLGFGLVAIFSFNASFGFRLAAVIGTTCWLWGEAFWNAQQLLLQQNFSIANANAGLWLDLVLPFILILCLLSIKKQGRRG